MKSGLISVSDLFIPTNKFYIPKYQRAYAWEEPHWKDFLEDILSHPTGNKYFYGTVLLRESGKESDFDLLEVVDGQQRITTVTVLMYVILQQLRQLGSNLNLDIKEEKYIKYHRIHKLKLGDDNDTEFIQTYVLNKDLSPSTFNTPAQRLLFESKDYFLKRLNNIGKDALESIVNTIESADILVYSVKESAEASLIFETTNDRGKSLTNLEKIKSFLMYKAYLSAGSNSGDIINNIYSRFGDIYNVLEKTKSIIQSKELKDVDEDRICQYHFIGFNFDTTIFWNIKQDYQNYLDVLKEYLNNLTQKKELFTALQFIDKYTISLRDTFNNFESILSFDNKSLDEIIYLERIAVFYPLMLKCYQYDDTNMKQHFSDLLNLFSKFSLRVFGLKFKRTNDVDLTLNKITRDFKGDIHSLINTLTEKVNDWAPMPEFVSRLRTSNFYNESKKTQNFLFWKYENYLRTTFQPICGEMAFEEFNDKNGRFRITIEHITSQTPRNGLEFCEMTNEFVETYLHNLGNLTIDPQSSNSSKGNEIWQNKNEKYFQKAPFKTQLELSDFVDDKMKKWDDTCIDIRREKIIEAAKILWKV